MIPTSPSPDPAVVVTIPASSGLSLVDEATRLRERLEEAEEVLRAIRSGHVDAVLVEGPQGDQLFTLTGADAPYRILIEEMNQGAVTLSAEGAILFCNRRFATLVARPMEEITGVAFDSFVVPTEREAFKAMLDAACTTGSAREVTLQTPGGSPVPAQLALSCLPTDSAAAICLIATDISDSKKVEAELKSSEARLSEAQQSAHIGSWESDIRTKAVSWSDELYRIYGFNRGEFVPTSENYTDGIHPDDRARVVELIRTALREKGSFDQDHRIIRRDGTHGVVQARGRVVLDEAGELLKFVGTNQDITERKEVEGALEKANGLLHDASRLAGMAEVATNVLHNVGNVLNSVNVSCSLISDRVAKSRIDIVLKISELLRENSHDLGTFFATDPVGQKLPTFLTKLSARLAEEQTAVLDEVRLLSQNIEHIKGIVAVQQMNARSVGGIRETLPIEGIVEDALRMNASALVEHQIKITRDYSEVPPLTMEKHKVLQILANLVSNAEHALADSGRADKQLLLRIARNNGHVSVSVIDNGVGIAPENLTRIFAHGFTTRKDGHGFGLHGGVLAAKELDGSLTVQSDGPGSGAIFTLNLPLGGAN